MIFLLCICAALGRSRFAAPILGLDTVFEFDGEEADFGGADVLDRVRRKGAEPLNFWDGGSGSGLAGVESDIALAVAADEFAGRKRVNDAGPTMRVDGYEATGSDADFENADAIVFKEQAMVSRGGGQGVERIGPGPGSLLQQGAPYVSFRLKRGGQSLALRTEVEESGTK
jgi:hypothetical protein